MSGIKDEHEGKSHRRVEEGEAPSVTPHPMCRDLNAHTLLSWMGGREEVEECEAFWFLFFFAVRLPASRAAETSRCVCA